MTGIPFWIGVPAEFKAKGYMHEGIALQRVSLEAASVDPSEAPIAVRFAGAGAPEANIRRFYAGDFWAPVFTHTPALFSTKNVASLPARTQLDLQVKFGVAKVAYGVKSSFGCPEITSVGIDRGAKFSEGWELAIADAHTAAERNVIVVDDICYRRSGTPLYGLSIASGQYMQISIVDSLPLPEGYLQTCFGLLDLEVMVGFRARHTRRNLRLHIPEVDVVPGASVERPEMASYAVGLRKWVLDEVPHSDFGVFPVEALLAVQALRKTDLTSEEILLRVIRLGQALGVDTEQPLTALVDPHARFTTRQDKRQDFVDMLSLPIHRIAHQWPQIDLVPEEDELALEML